VSNNISRRDRKSHSGSHSKSTNKGSNNPEPRSPNHDEDDPARTQHCCDKQQKRDWYDYTTLAALIAAFVAAGALAFLTRCSLDDARIAATTAHEDNVSALAHAKDIAVKSHADAVAALQRAAEANINAQKTADRQLRPYVGLPPTYSVVCKDCDKATTSTFPEKGHAGMQNFMNFSLKNYGLTPAYRPDPCFEWEWQPLNYVASHKTFDDFKARCNAVKPTHFSPTIWPNESRPYPMPLEPRAVQSLIGARLGTNSFFAFLWIYYEDSGGGIAQHVLLFQISLHGRERHSHSKFEPLQDSTARRRLRPEKLRSLVGGKNSN
jgi:hypothetical protein